MESTTEIITGIKSAAETKSVDDALLFINQFLALDITDTNILNAIDFTDLSSYFETLFALDNQDLKTKISKSIAETAKIEQQRNKFTNAGMIKQLLDILQKHSTNSKAIDLVIQTCRGLGNICFVNDDAKLLITNENGDEILINLFDNDFDEVEDDDLKKQYYKARGGLVSNYLIGLESEETIKRTIDLELLEKITKILEKSVEDVEKNEALLLHSLPPLSILTENMSDVNFEPRLNKLLAQTLKLCTNPEVAELILELLNYQAENDDVKLLLAKEGLCEMIFILLEKNKEQVHTNHSKALMKSACDLIIIILTGDESMLYLYKSKLVKYMEAWLDSPDVGLQTTGVLALGNFARTDSHCIDMVKNKVVHKLIGILSRNNGVDNDMRLQHALLSTLKNLVIPKVNKAAIIEAGLVETILPMLEIHTAPVVFKLLGTLRMMVDGQEKLAQNLLKNEKLIKQLIVWSKSTEFAGVTGESFRLMAWIIKHAYQLNNRETTVVEKIDDSSLKTFIQIEGAVESMVMMLMTTHLVMQNEALIALSLISTIFHRTKQDDINLDELFVQCELGEKLSEFIKKNADNMTKEIVENLQSFIKLLHVSDKMIAHLNKYNIDELLKSIPSLVEYCTL